VYPTRWPICPLSLIAVAEDEEVIFPRRIKQFIQVDHLSAARIWPPEKSHLLHDQLAWEITVTNNLVQFVDTQSYADVGICPLRAERSEIDHALAIMQERVNALVVSLKRGIAGDVVCRR
jgi:hypothetical protein